METKKNSLLILRNKITKIKVDFVENIQSEFESFDLSSVLTTNDSNMCFQKIQSVIGDSHSSEGFKTKLQSIQSSFKNYLSEVNSVFQILAKNLAENKDIKLHYIFDTPFPENKTVLLEVKEKIELIKTEFDSKIQNEFQQISLLKANPNEIEIKSLPILQEKVNALAEKIQSDNWTVENLLYNSKWSAIVCFLLLEKIDKNLKLKLLIFVSFIKSGLLLLLLKIESILETL